MINHWQGQLSEGFPHVLSSVQTQHHQIIRASTCSCASAAWQARLNSSLHFVRLKRQDFCLDIEAPGNVCITSMNFHRLEMFQLIASHACWRGGKPPNLWDNCPCPAVTFPATLRKKMVSRIVVWPALNRRVPDPVRHRWNVAYCGN